MVLCGGGICGDPVATVTKKSRQKENLLGQSNVHSFAYESTAHNMAAFSGALIADSHPSVRWSSSMHLSVELGMMPEIIKAIEDIDWMYVQPHRLHLHVVCCLFGVVVVVK